MDLDYKYYGKKIREGDVYGIKVYNLFKEVK
jgi:hypothetical protein